jgi:hypothetical protein
MFVKSSSSIPAPLALNFRISRRRIPSENELDRSKLVRLNRVRPAEHLRGKTTALTRLVANGASLLCSFALVKNKIVIVTKYELPRQFRIAHCPEIAG